MKQIPLTKGLFALIDDEDYEDLSKFKWHVIKGADTFYAARKTKGTGKFRGTILMHRFLLSASQEFQVDHIDLNGLNNTRANLRLATARQNRQNRKKTSSNRSGYKGVIKNKSAKLSDRWCAYIVVDGKRRYLGSFSSPEEAAKVYDKSALEFFGEFANLNYPI